MQFKLDYPAIACSECIALEETDGVERECIKGKCPIPDISSDNLTAFELYCQINNQFVYDFHLAGEVIEASGLALTSDGWMQLFHRCSVIHKVIKEHGKSG